jgi:CheY-like chemotaxis protein
MTEPANKPKVLIAEDDEVLRPVLCRTMEWEGYQVVVAADGQDALRLLAEPSQVDLIITDICMPKMDGRELGLVLAECHPDIPILFISGYADSVVPATLPGPLLPKPFTPTQLIVGVRQLRTERGSQFVGKAGVNVKKDDKIKKKDDKLEKKDDDLERPDSPWIAGMRVIHPLWGWGIIQAVSREKGTLDRATVAFDSGRLETFDIDGSGLRRKSPTF